MAYIAGYTAILGKQGRRLIEKRVIGPGGRLNIFEQRPSC
jgi:hypothetical protein